MRIVGKDGVPALQRISSLVEVECVWWMYVGVGLCVGLVSTPNQEQNKSLQVASSKQERKQKTFSNRQESLSNMDARALAPNIESNREKSTVKRFAAHLQRRLTYAKRGHNSAK